MHQVENRPKRLQGCWGARHQEGSTSPTASHHNHQWSGPILGQVLQAQPFLTLDSVSSSFKKAPPALWLCPSQHPQVPVAWKLDSFSPEIIYLPLKAQARGWVLCCFTCLKVWNRGPGCGREVSAGFSVLRHGVEGGGEDFPKFSPLASKLFLSTYTSTRIYRLPKVTDHDGG